ncbi:MAG: CoA transferase, partial [Alphaproteobacteria bacterium]
VALNAAIEELTKPLTTEALIDKLTKAGVPCGPIYTIDKVFADPQVKHLGMAQRVHSDWMGDMDCVRQPISLSRTPSHIVKATPKKGESTDEIMASLGYSADDIAALRKRDVI